MVILTVKTIRRAEMIAKALNEAKPGSGNYYMTGYQARKMTELAAVKAQK